MPAAEEYGIAIIGTQQEPVGSINDDATRRSLAAPKVANRQSWKLFRLLRSFFAAECAPFSFTGTVAAAIMINV
jgi:hypothetical protein